MALVQSQAIEDQGSLGKVELIIQIICSKALTIAFEPEVTLQVHFPSNDEQSMASGRAPKIRYL